MITAASGGNGFAKAQVRIVVVDDHPFIRELICRALSKESGNYDVVATVGTAADGITACKDLEPDLLVLDITLPDSTGVATVPHIRRVSPSTRILLCTAYPKDDWINTAAACGADGFVEKTNTWDDFMVAVARVAQGGRYFSAGGPRPGSVLSVPVAAAADGLTRREREILQLIGEGLTTKEIAARLSISVPTVETHRGNLMGKTGARNVAGLVRLAINAGSS